MNVESQETPEETETKETPAEVEVQELEVTLVTLEPPEHPVQLALKENLVDLSPDEMEPLV